MDLNTYENEQSLIFKYFINTIEDCWKDKEKKIKSPPFLEFFITPDCNQNCSYCYLQKNKQFLYPKEYRDNNLILKNLDIYLNYLLENKIIYIPRLDLFSGEIWGWPLGNKVFDLLLSYIDKGLQISYIIIPSNCSFCLDDNLIKIIDYYIYEFKKRKVSIDFSISMDGLYLDKTTRPLTNSDKTEEYYSKIFSFSKKYNYGFHPMIDAATIEHQKNNYLSWMSSLQKVYKEDFIHQYGSIMQLEVRSNNWTDDKIQKYIDWLNYVYETDKKLFFNNSKENLLNFLLGDKTTNTKINFNHTYLPYNFIVNEDNTLGCALGRSLAIRLGDLSVVPCHRTAYDKFIFGKFIIENDKIIDMQGKNISLLNGIFKTGYKNKPYCENCYLYKHCIQYCLGANYEESKELFYPSTSNCKLQKIKNLFIALKYINEGLENLNTVQQFRKQSYLQFFQKIINNEETKEWIPIITKIIQQN